MQVQTQVQAQARQCSHSRFRQTGAGTAGATIGRYWQDRCSHKQVQAQAGTGTVKAATSTDRADTGRHRQSRCRHRQERPVNDSGVTGNNFKN